MKIPSSARYRRRMGFSGIDVRRDESVLDFSVSPCAYNFDFSSGALRSGYGIAAHPSVPKEAVRYWVYRFADESGAAVEQYVYQTADGHLGYRNAQSGSDRFMTNVKFPPMTALNYRLNSKDILFLACDEKPLMSWDGSRLREHTGSPMISSMALHYERLFVTARDSPTKVFFSDDLDPTNWKISSDAGGFIELLDERGALNRVVSFGNYLYIFREHGISRVTAFAEQREFSVTDLFVSAGRIYPNSITKCGSVIMFAASDGLYVFDGYECRRTLKNLDGLLLPQSVTASAYFDGRYYLACKADFGDGRTVGAEAGEYAANALLTYSVGTGEYSLSRGLDISFMNACSYGGVDFLAAGDGGCGGIIVRCGKRFEEDLPKHWQSPETDFSAADMKKSVRDVYVQTTAPVTVTVSDGKRSRAVTVKAGRRRVRAGVFEGRISLALDAGCDCEIKPLTLVFSAY